MHNDILKVLLTEEQLKEKTKELAAKVSKDYRDKNVLIISVLKGAFIFAADFIRELDIMAEIDFMVTSSYGTSTKSSGVVQIIKDIQKDITGMDILIVEDILDSGLTLSYLKKLFLTRGANSVKVCTILNKPERRKADIEPDYVGYDVPDEFVVGYGLDFNEKYRQLPYVGVLKPEVYENV